MAPPNKTTKITSCVSRLQFVLPMVGTAIPELFTASPASLPMMHHLLQNTTDWFRVSLSCSKKQTVMGP